jgi:type II secretory pathway pseudopilin PulG
VKAPAVLRQAVHRLRRSARLGSRIPARIRDKLAWWFLATLTLQIVVYALVVFFLMQRSLEQQVERLLDMDARAITEALMSQQQESGGRAIGAGLVDGLGTGLMGSDAQAVLWYQAEDKTPHALAATPGAPTLPAPDFFETQRRSLVTAADGDAYYLRSIEVAGDGGARYLVQAARPAARGCCCSACCQSCFSAGSADGRLPGQRWRRSRRSFAPHAPFASHACPSGCATAGPTTSCAS